MRMVLAGGVEPAQLGAFLLVLRLRAETPAELAGFVDAARAVFVDGPEVAADLDWPSYADKHKQLPYFVLSALLLAHHGLRVAMHGIPGIGPASTPAVLRALGLSPATSWAAAETDLRQRCFTYLPLAAFCPALMPLFDLRPLLGVRSPANSFCRDLNPFSAAFQIQGVFHPSYLATHRATAQLLRQPHAAIFKGGGGEAQCNPEKPLRVATLRDSVAGEVTWPALAPALHHPWRDEDLDPHAVVALWRGDLAAPGPEAAIIGTTAIALELCGRAAAPDDALAQASIMWQERPRTKYG